MLCVDMKLVTRWRQEDRHRERRTNSSSERDRARDRSHSLCLGGTSSGDYGLLQALHRRASSALSSASELISRRGVFSRRQYGSVEQIPQTPEGGAAADQSCRRFRLENGESIGEKDEMFGSPAAPVLENPEFQTRWYFKYFLGKLHQNYVGLDATKEPFLVSVVQTTGGPVRAILFNKMGTQKISLPPSAWGGANLSSSNAMGTTSSTRPAVKNILQHFPGMEKLEKGPREVMCPEIQKDILLLEEQEGSVNFKFGVILMKDGQVVDDEMLSNEFGSEHWDRFLNLLGERIRLRGWRRFRGGLDVKGDMTGSHAVYTMHQGHEIMFHVSTMLPFSKDNKQQVERKRHIGNDIVNVIFVESGAHENFNPQCIKSHFTHVFAVVSPVVNNSSTSYRLSVFCDQAVPPFGPSLPCPSIFSDPQLFREFLLVKLMNGEKATFQTPTFALKRQRTLNTLIRDLYQEHGGEHKMPMLSRRALSDVWASGGSGGPGGGGGGDARTERFLRTGQALKLDAVLRGDAPTSLASAPGFGYLRRVPWEAQALGVLPPPGSIICADSWGDQRLIMATTCGVYMVEEGSPLKQLLPRWDIPVRQLQLCESHGLMLLRAGCAAASGRLYALRLASLAAGAYRNLTRVDAKPLRVDKTKGCHLFAVSKPGVSHVRVAVACGRRVVLLQARRSAAWATWCAANVTPALIPAGAPSSETALENDDAADDFAIIKDFQLTELPFLMSIVEGHSRDADLICIGYKQHWELLSQTTGQPLKWSTSSCPHGHSSASAESSGGRGALVAALQLTDDKDTQLLLCYNHTCHFQRLTDTGLEDSNEFDFHWTTVPIAVVCSFPYVMAFAEDLLEIRLVANGSLVHATNLPGLKLLSSKKDIFYTANAPEYVPIARDLERGSFSIETVTNSPSKTINKQLTLLSREGNDCLERDASIDTKQGDCVSSSSRSSSVSSEHDPLKSLMKKGQSASPPSSPHNSTSDYTNPKNLRERIYRICSGSFSANSINQRQSSSADPVSHPIPTNECNETVVKSDTDADAATEGPAARSTNGCPSTTGPNKSSTFSATKRCPSIPTANIHDQ